MPRQPKRASGRTQKRAPSRAKGKHDRSGAHKAREVPSGKRQTAAHLGKAGSAKGARQRLTGPVREAISVDVARLYFTRREDGEQRYTSAQIVSEINRSRGLGLTNDRWVPRIVRGTLDRKTGGPLLALSLRDTRPSAEKLRESHDLLKRAFPLVFDRTAAAVVDETLSDELSDQFVCLWSATAVQMPPEILSEERPVQKSNRIHAVIAQTMAAQIMGFARNGDHVAFGGGRGPLNTCERVHQVMDVLAAHPARIPQWTDMRLTSLTGCLDATQWLEEDEVLAGRPAAQGRADADDAVLAFAGACVAPTITTVGCTIAIPSGAERDHFIKRRVRHLDLKEWESEGVTDASSHQCVPHWCVVGVGAVADGHRLMRDNARLDPVREEVDRLRAILRQQDPRERSPVGDVCNRLFVVDRAGIKGRAELEDITRRINERLVCATEGHLRRVERVLIVAGGAGKASALAHVLRHELAGSRVVLVTDSECASAMLALPTEGTR